ncbi:hypothetical protein IVB15_24820 [Bradyrhizobium sp. 182]|nr:hypothetical protein [Bradyrhizobium sp. 182]
MASQLFRRFEREEDHSRHVGPRPAQQYNPDVPVALLNSTDRFDDPVRAALVFVWRRNRDWGGILYRDDLNVFGPLYRACHAWDTKIGSKLADALVKSFSAEACEDARLARTINGWRKRRRRTWLRYDWRRDRSSVIAYREGG